MQPDDGDGDRGITTAPAAAPALADAYAQMIAECIPAVVDDILHADRRVEGWQHWAYVVQLNRLMATYREAMHQVLPQYESLHVACAAYPNIEYAAFRPLRSLLHHLVTAADEKKLDGYSMDQDRSERDQMIDFATFRTEDALPLLQGRIAGR